MLFKIKNGNIEPKDSIFCSLSFFFFFFPIIFGGLVAPLQYCLVIQAIWVNLFSMIMNSTAQHNFLMNELYFNKLIIMSRKYTCKKTFVGKHGCSRPYALSIN